MHEWLEECVHCWLLWRASASTWVVGPEQGEPPSLRNYANLVQAFVTHRIAK